MNKSEYLKQLKHLIKKFHPDLCKDSKFEPVYNEITVKLVNKLNKIKESTAVKNAEGGSDYAWYKLGIKYYRNIHPNQFYKRNADTTFETKTYKEWISALNKIHLSFDLSKYYFKKVADEYPQSPYSEDSRTKIQLLKKLYKSYENIIFEENRIVNNDKFINDMGLKILNVR